MRLKGLIQFFTVALVLICLYQLSFTWVVNRVEKKADAFAERKVLHGKTLADASGTGADKALIEDSLNTAIHRAKETYLDSLETEQVYNLVFAKYTYQECKKNELKLGLDLKGGMSVVMQVSMEDIIRGMTDNNPDKTLNQALINATARQVREPNTNYITLFGEEFAKLDPKASLAALFSTRENQSKIKINDNNDQVLSVIRKEADDAFDRTYNILRKRIDKFGVAQPSITAQPSFGRIVVELPGVDNPQRVRNLLQSAAKLEFWDTWESAEVDGYLEKANTELKNHKAGVEKDSTKTDTSATAKNKSNDTSKAASAFGGGNKTSAKSPALNKEEADNPLFSKLQLNVARDQQGNAKAQQGPIVGYARGRDTAKINKMLAEDYVRAILPRNLRLLWGAKGLEDSKNIYQLYAIKTRLNEPGAPLEGDKIVEAHQDYDQTTNKPNISMKMDAEGSRTWREMTAAAANHSGKPEDPKRCIAIVLDDYVQSSPIVNDEISGGNSQISGNFTVDEAKDLATVLQTGKLPAPARIIAEEVVGPSLGAESIRAGIISVLVAILAVIVFMVVYYNNSGYIADIALFFNLLFTIGVLASFSATLTMPGIAGLVLSLAIAVDANVIIQERIKEELRRGSGLVKAITDGHTKSYVTLFDANLTTLITGIILLFFGLGPVTGFATTLIIGTVLTLFTALFLAHLIYDWALKRNKKIEFTTRISHNNFANANYDFVGKRKIAYLFSGTLAVIGLISIFTKGFDLGVDFKGGRSYVVRFVHDVNTTDIRRDVAAVMNKETPVVKTIGSKNQVKITTAYMSNVQTSAAGDSVSRLLFKGIQSQLPANTTYDQFKSKYLMTSSDVGPTISNDIKIGSIKAIAYALIAIFVFILIRFRRWQYSLGAIISLAHDVLMVMGIYSLLSGIVPFALEVDETFIAAILTVMGYSMNDTVIVYDRIREYLRDHPGGDMKKTINDAINNTLNRTIITSATVFLVLLILFIFGGDSIRGFTFAMLLGIVFGTYSSIFVATPIVIDFSKESREPAKSVGGTNAPKKAATLK